MLRLHVSSKLPGRLLPPALMHGVARLYRTKNNPLSLETALVLMFMIRHGCGESGLEQVVLT